jgi:putative transposase
MVVSVRGKPQMIVSDNGTEFTSNAMLMGEGSWCQLALHRARPADKERLHQSFNGRMRDELLNGSLFFDLDQARWLVAAWVADYNTARPHSSLGYKTPAAYAGPRSLFTGPNGNGRTTPHLQRSPKKEKSRLLAPTRRL